jgi:adenylate cyclase
VEVRPISTLKDVRPREVMDILNVFLSVATEAIQETQGVIDKYMGQEVMAMWNTQLNPMQNHAEMAIECALRMREKFIALYAELGINPEPHYYRVGIHSGVATLGNVGSINRRDFTAIGDTINLSKRLEENATRQQIIISQDSLEQLQAHHDNDINALTFEERAPIKVKGRQQETRIYEVFRA